MLISFMFSFLFTAYPLQCFTSRYTSFLGCFINKNVFLVCFFLASLPGQLWGKQHLQIGCLGKVFAKRKSPESVQAKKGYHYSRRFLNPREIHFDGEGLYRFVVEMISEDVCQTCQFHQKKVMPKLKVQSRDTNCLLL